MVLTEKALLAINNKRTRQLIALALEITEQSVIKHIKSNNDILTKAASMAVIRKETGLSDEEILEAADAVA